jgi:chromosomal replication initiation ATPase DnaA
MINFYIAPGLSYIHLQGAIKSAKQINQSKKEIRLSENEALAHRIMLIVSEHYNITIEQLRDECRRSEFRTARQVAQDLIRYKAELPLKKIGKMFNRHHTTVIYSLKSIANMRRFYKTFDAEYKEIESHV